MLYFNAAATNEGDQTVIIDSDQEIEDSPETSEDSESIGEDAQQIQADPTQSSQTGIPRDTLREVKVQPPEEPPEKNG